VQTTLNWELHENERLYRVWSVLYELTTRQLNILLIESQFFIHFVKLFCCRLPGAGPSESLANASSDGRSGRGPQLVNGRAVLFSWPLKRSTQFFSFPTIQLLLLNCDLTKSHRWDFEPEEPLSTFWRLWKVDRMESANLESQILFRGK
jgi:hypothetical protein